jgi:hypothetical protein
MAVSRTHGQSVSLVEITTDRANVLNVKAGNIITRALHAKITIPEPVWDKIALRAGGSLNIGIDCDTHHCFSVQYSSMERACGAWVTKTVTSNQARMLGVKTCPKK